MPKKIYNGAVMSVKNASVLDANVMIVEDAIYIYYVIVKESEILTVDNFILQNFGEFERITISPRALGRNEKNRGAFAPLFSLP